LGFFLHSGKFHATMKLHSRLLAGFCLLVCSLTQAQAPHSDHVVIVTLENHSYEQVIGNAAMPYFNQLASQYGLADAYFATQHNSLAALMWLTTGSQVTTNNSTREIFNVDHIAARVWQSGKSWKAYLESLPSIGFTDYAVSGPYLKRHAPFAYFSDVVTSNQRFNLVPLEPYFAQDIANRALPNFSYVVPDAGDDAHDGTLAQADQWLQSHIPQLLADPDFQNDGLLFIVWDEGNLGPLDARWTGGRVATLVIGPGVKPGYRSTTFYTHQDLLRTLCDAMGLGRCPGNGAIGVPMADFFPPASTSPHIQLLSPTTNLNAVRNPLRFVANVVSDKPASAMIVYADHHEIFRTQGGHTDFKMDLSPGAHLLVVNGWDSSGRLMQASVSVNVVDHGVSANACLVNQSTPSVTICSAQGGQSVASPVRVVAETVDQQAEVLTVAISVDNQELYLAYGNRVDTDLALAPGVHHVVVRAHDILGANFESAADVNVLPAPPPPVTATPSITLGSVLDGSSSSSPLHLVAALNSSLPASAMLVYSDDREVFRTYNASLDTYLDLKAGRHHIVISAWDSAGNLSTKDGLVTVADRIESCNEYRPAVSVTICTLSNTNAAPGIPTHFVAAARSDGKTITAMIVYADGREIQRTYSNYADFQATLAPGTHSMVVNAWDNAGTLMQASTVVTPR
jgi:acid phosphatase